MTTSVYADLQGRSVLVSGGATGIGSTLVEHFAQQSARVAFVDIAVKEGHALADRLTGEGLAVTFFPCDITDTGAYQQTIVEVAEARVWFGLCIQPILCSLLTIVLIPSMIPSIF
jgi:NAD(P)-dependent dehydrogenase (short-subunit alcohol dehydrogenase family)